MFSLSQFFLLEILTWSNINYLFTLKWIKGRELKQKKIGLLSRRGFLTIKNIKKLRMNENHQDSEKLAINKICS